MNNQERAQWIHNDEGLYSWWKSTRGSKAAFIRENREAIDQAINAVTGGVRPQSYGGRGPRAQDGRTLLPGTF